MSRTFVRGRTFGAFQEAFPLALDPHPDESELLARAESGDSTALDELFLWVCEPLVHFFDVKLSAEDRARFSGGDVVRETLVRAIRGFDGFRLQGSPDFSSWLTEIGEMVLADLRGSRGGGKASASDSETTIDQDSVAHLIDQLAGADQGSLDVRREELVGAVATAMDDMSDEFRQVVSWQYFEGLSPSEIASRLGLTPSAAQALCDRARDQLCAAIGASSHKLRR